MRVDANIEKLHVHAIVQTLCVCTQILERTLVFKRSGFVGDPKTAWERWWKFEVWKCETTAAIHRKKRPNCSVHSISQKFSTMKLQKKWFNWSHEKVPAATLQLVVSSIFALEIKTRRTRSSNNGCKVFTIFKSRNLKQFRLFVEGPEEQSRHLGPQDQCLRNQQNLDKFNQSACLALEARHASWNLKEISTWGQKSWRWTTWHFSHVTGFEFCMCTHPENRIANACKLDIHLQTHACINLDFLAEVPGPLGAFSWDMDHIQVFRIS